MNSKIKVDKFVIVVFLLCMVCNMTMQAKAYESFKVSIYVRAYEVDKMKDIHWLDSTWNVIHNSWKWTRFIWKHTGTCWSWRMPLWNRQRNSFMTGV